MERMLQQLAAINDFTRERREPACWRVARIDRPRPVVRMPVGDTAPDPSSSIALARWRRLLANRPLPPAYRIARI